MKLRNRKIVGIGAITAMLIFILIIGLFIIPNNSEYSTDPTVFPDFYTKTQDYFVTRIGAIPKISEHSYELKIIRCIENLINNNLSELETLPLIEFRFLTFI